MALHPMDYVFESETGEGRDGASMIAICRYGIPMAVLQDCRGVGPDTGVSDRGAYPPTMCRIWQHARFYTGGVRILDPSPSTSRIYGTKLVGEHFSLPRLGNRQLCREPQLSAGAVRLLVTRQKMRLVFS